MFDRTAPDKSAWVTSPAFLSGAQAGGGGRAGGGEGNRLAFRYPPGTRAH